MMTRYQVFVTKKGKIRVEIETRYESFEPGTDNKKEITIGGKRWFSGELCEADKIVIERCCNKLIHRLMNQKNKYFNK